MRHLLVCLACATVLPLSGCGSVARTLEDNGISYRIPLQQGNVVEQAQLDALKPGMDKRQVRNLLGTPMLADPFHKSRWDYVYTFRPRFGDTEQRRLTLYFKDDLLADIQGDERPQAAEGRVRNREAVVEVPDYEARDSLLDKALGVVGLGGN
ncbi:MAG: outer membrane protein assembly factor BamE [Rhodospirillales bacterium]|jgi:outer membrane protein assembly factor BamE|nr:outer membrane protein assembly factor BamE [Desulfobacterales bacterium]MCU0895310.1 outer membrane protein assembly factor BamE [Rhodospirillales bacterium]